MPFTPNVKTCSASADGVSIAYYESEPQQPDRETIVLLHGTGGTAENNFWALFPMLAMRHRVVALDFVDPKNTPPDSDSYVRQVHAVVDAAIQEGRPVHVVGYSFGAVIAAVYAARHGSTVKSLTLVCGWVRTDLHQRLRNAIWRKLYQSGHEAIAELSVFTAFSQPFLNSRNEAELAALVQGIQRGPDRSIKMAFNAVVDISEELSAIACPTLVVGCSLDITTPIRHARMLFGGIANSRFFEINSGHAVVHERPAELFTIVDDFVRAPTDRAAGYVYANAHA